MRFFFKYETLMSFVYVFYVTQRPVIAIFIIVIITRSFRRRRRPRPRRRHPVYSSRWSFNTRGKLFPTVVLGRLWTVQNDKTCSYVLKYVIEWLPSTVSLVNFTSSLISMSNGWYPIGSGRDVVTRGS